MLQGYSASQPSAGLTPTPSTYVYAMPESD